MRLLSLYRRLLRQYGRQRWWPAETRYEVVAGALLTQNTSWKNVERALANLKKAGALSPQKIVHMRRARLESLIRPSGFYRQKAERLAVVCAFFLERGGVAGCRREETAALREGLLGLKGIGPETCDDILCYALERPVFVVDEYTRRIARGLRLTDDLSYDGLQRFFETGVRRDWRLYQDFHALIVRHGKETAGTGYEL
jgi:endonuclease-3 related protein